MEEKIYTEAFVSNLFDNMSMSYVGMNTFTSFGFYPLWRRLAIKKIQLKEGDMVTDLLTGVGECWPSILKHIGNSGRLTALDFSKGMIAKAKKRKQDYPYYDIHILEESVFENSIPDASQDAVICAYGLKTFQLSQIDDFSGEIARILKPGGQFSLVDVSLPRIGWLRKAYLFYISKVIPFLGRILANEKESYKMLGVYSRNFSDTDTLLPLFTAKGLEVNSCNYFFGCAMGLYGHKP
ncbi:class I SAM-dependent methyltransferase [Leptobacterium flavescens]|uniref:Class I SAM-dependent methyltransferase n=1 Tax=Leptobacterium flavescens TaxID=472055 RepID=A0A6P0UM67_9FLAO|nr:class I SAM-dependent methyltransferase [Leptobacterium flavescens]NER12939.1 class I SAM-dependent methyltransferase [Leptobacterium flavescens]